MTPAPLEQRACRHRSGAREAADHRQSRQIQRSTAAAASPIPPRHATPSATHRRHHKTASAKTPLSSTPSRLAHAMRRSPSTTISITMRSAAPPRRLTARTLASVRLPLQGRPPLALVITRERERRKERYDKGVSYFLERKYRRITRTPRG